MNMFIRKSVSMAKSCGGGDRDGCTFMSRVSFPYQCQIFSCDGGLIVHVVVMHLG